MGSLTSLDKLTMEIQTNGAISPEDALKFASNVLKSYFNLFNVADVAVEPDFMTDATKLPLKKKKKKPKNRPKNLTRRLKFWGFLRELSMP